MSIKENVPAGHRKLVDRKVTGAHYTPPELARFVSENIYKCLNETRGKDTVILDPAVGDGELLLAMAEQGIKGRIFKGADIDEVATKHAKKSLIKNFPDIKLEMKTLNFLEEVENQGNLFSHNDSFSDLVDGVISNPPYVRTQVLGASESQRLAKKYGLTGRVDIYHAFIAKISQVLKPGGVAGLIVSNRFMYTQGGKSIREFIIKEFDILHIWDFGDTKIFEASVLPAVLILRKKTSQSTEIVSTLFTSIYECETGEKSIRAKSIYTALGENGVVAIGNKSYRISKGVLHIEDGQPWRISEKSIDEWLAKVKKNTAKTFKDVSKSKVGVKTTADKVFIAKDWPDKEPELLYPLTTHHIARRFHSTSPTRKILYPYDMNSDSKKPVDLDQYPNTKLYLERHSERLKSRTYVIESGRQWFEIWVPHKPSQWKQPKLVYRDISEQPTFWLDFEGTIVNGDCYWSSLKGVDENTMWLMLAIANSTFIEKFYDYRFNNKLYSGRRRFISQYVNDFPIPKEDNPLSLKIITLTKKIYNGIESGKVTTKKEQELDKLVWEVFDVS